MMHAILVAALLAHSEGGAFGDASGGGGISSTDFDTSSELATILTDETGSGAACFATSPTFTTSITVGASAAGSGAIRLPNASQMCWEASPAGTDECISFDAAEGFVVTGPVVLSTSGDPADTGIVQLGNNDCIASEASPAGTDGTICFDTSEYWSFSEPVLVSGSDTTTPSIFRSSGAAAQVNIEAYGGAPTVVTAGAGGTFGSGTTTQSGDNVGNFVGQTFLSGTGFQTAAAFQFIATETVDAAGRGTKIDWYTTPNNSTTLTKRWTFEQDGALTGHTTSSIGWAIVAGANTACNTTCTSGCVFGIANGSEADEQTIVACTDATADSCLCAGAS